MNIEGCAWILNYRFHITFFGPVEFDNGDGTDVFL